MFHSELYPTPLEVLQLMNLESQDKIILEPHAGFGNIIDYCKDNGAKKVLAFEIDERCQAIVKEKCQLLGDDFFKCKPEQISHIHAIYMNPPFSNAERHIWHAWEVAPEGCEIVSLCNFQTIDNLNRFPKLRNIVTQYGNTENLGDCFSTAERSTGIDIGLIRLYKPISSNQFEFDGFYLDEDDAEVDGEGIMQYNEVRALVNRYVFTMKAFDNLKEQIDNMNHVTKDIGLSSIEMKIGYDKSVTDKQTFSKIVQKQSWDHIFKKMNMEKYVTSGVMKDINKFVETQVKVPFTMKNIYRMLQIIVGTRQQTFNKALEEAIDNFTKHSHDNRFGVEGWKTNSGYMLNKKFIVENIVGFEYSSDLRVKYDTYGLRKIDDLIKVLCNILAKDYNEVGSLYRFNFNNTKYEVEGIKSMDKKFDLEPNAWYNWHFFDIKFYKKGTMHIKFKNTNEWYLLNKAYGELKGFSLPEEHRN